VGERIEQRGSLVGIVARRGSSPLQIEGPHDGRKADGGMISAFISVIFVLIVILLVGGVLVAALVSVAESLPRRKLAEPRGKDRKS
jgi:hypothetical protein